jgi:hypothetical protein
MSSAAAVAAEIRSFAKSHATMVQMALPGVDTDGTARDFAESISLKLAHCKEYGRTSQQFGPQRQV